MPEQPIVLCKICNVSITNPDYRVILCQEEYPDIEIGPYCESCFSKIKICSGCQKPFLNTEVTHTGNGDHFCSTCISNIVRCECCNTVMADNLLESIDGRKICKRCKAEHYFTCNCCDKLKAKESRKDPYSLEGVERSGVFRKYKMICTDCFDKKKSFFKKYPVRTCQHCSTVYKLTGAHSHESFCSSCWDSFPTCNYCDHKGSNVSSHYIDGRYRHICSKCVGTKVSECTECGKFTAKPTILKKGLFKDHKVCEHCAVLTSCEKCGTLFSGSGKICDKCLILYESNKCPDCGRIRDHAKHCRVCYDQKIYEYSRKPHLYFNVAEGEHVGSVDLFGIENEVCFKSNSQSEKALKTLYTAYDPSVLLAKSDGSIPTYGFEIVTQPMSLKFFKKMNVEALVPDKSLSDNRCGLHIHVNRKSFISDLHIYKVINFLNDNRAFAEYVAGRTFCDYASSIKRKVTKFIEDSKRRRAERRSIVNLNNKNTIEFRLYCGCTTEFELRSRVEFTIGLIEFCRITGISAVSIKELIGFFKKNEKTYPNAFKLVSQYES